LDYFLTDEAATLDLGRQISAICPQQLLSIYLEGELGAGKTTFTRGFLTALGHSGNVKSPTYTLVEHYQINQRNIYHFDLYRLSDPEELEFLGLDEYFHNNAICLVEWAQQGQGFLPKADLTLRFSYQQQSRSVEITPHSALGEEICEKLHK